MKDYVCELCIHKNVCPAYEVTMVECEHYLPSGNVAPVVRCRDCKYYKNGRIFTETKFCFRLKNSEGKTVAYNWSDYDFCSYGERKEGAE